MNAEIARIEGRELDAERLYEKSIESARANGFLQNEALAYERAAVFYRGRGLEKFARGYLTEAAACYARWGATGKVRQLETLDPWLRQNTGLEGATLAGRLDSVAVAKAQQAISSEILLEPLARTLLRIVMENAGAQTGYLTVEGNRHLRAVMRYGLEERQITFDAEPTRENTPHAILNYVRRTRETIALSNPGAKSGEFAADEYFARVQPKSVLCLPIRRKAQLLGILCLENNLAADAFTLERRTVLEMLAAQAAISLETAGVHEALKASESKYRQIVATATEGIWAAGPDNLTTFVNPRLADLLGYSAEEMLGRPVADFLFSQDLADHEEILKLRREGMSGQYERRFRRKDGQTIWAIVSAAPNFDQYGRYQGLIAMLTDITGRKRAEEAVLEERVQERTRIARDLHDTLLQSFNGVLIHLAVVSRRLRSQPEEAQKLLDDTIDQARRAIREGREAVQGLRNSTQELNNLAEALRQFAAELVTSTSPPGTRRWRRTSTLRCANRTAGRVTASAPYHQG